MTDLKFFTTLGRDRRVLCGRCCADTSSEFDLVELLPEHFPGTFEKIRCQSCGRQPAAVPVRPRRRHMGYRRSHLSEPLHEVTVSGTT